MVGRSIHKIRTRRWSSNNIENTSSRGGTQKFADVVVVGGGGGLMAVGTIEVALRSASQVV